MAEYTKVLLVGPDVDVLSTIQDAVAKAAGTDVVLYTNDQDAMAGMKEHRGSLVVLTGGLEPSSMSRLGGEGWRHKCRVIEVTRPDKVPQRVASAVQD